MFLSEHVQWDFMECLHELGSSSINGNSMRFSMVSLNLMVTVVYLIGEMSLVEPGLLGLFWVNYNGSLT